MLVQIVLQRDRETPFKGLEAAASACHQQRRTDVVERVRPNAVVAERFRELERTLPKFQRLLQVTSGRGPLCAGAVGHCEVRPGRECSSRAMASATC